MSIAIVALVVILAVVAVRGAMEVIGGRLPHGSKEASIVTDIVTRLDALNDLIKDLLLFARPPQLRPAAVDVLPLIASTAELLSQDPALRGVRVELQGSVPPITADPQLLKIVFQNLLVNAAHAIEGQGQLKVDVRAVDSTCQIAFTDHGPGIPPEIREKVFTPFFTT
jgi:signal transduction histidine kinase